MPLPGTDDPAIVLIAVQTTSLEAQRLRAADALDVQNDDIGPYDASTVIPTGYVLVRSSDISEITSEFDYKRANGDVDADTDAAITRMEQAVIDQGVKGELGEITDAQTA